MLKEGYWPKEELIEKAKKQNQSCDLLDNGLSEEELDEIIEAIHDQKIDIKVWICLFDYAEMREYIICWGYYKNKHVEFQQRDDWGIIYHSILWGDLADPKFNLKSHINQQKKEMILKIKRGLNS